MSLWSMQQWNLLMMPENQQTQDARTHTHTHTHTHASHTFTIYSLLVADFLKALSVIGTVAEHFAAKHLGNDRFPNHHLAC